MQWDVFCRVIDNFGDIGVCWRLCTDLAQRGHQIRLWVDDATALEWMAPAGYAGDLGAVQILDWEQSKNSRLIASLRPADVWVEGFGCEIATEYIAAYAYPERLNGEKCQTFPVWINLEYLSAENYVERCHGLPSPVQTGPAAGQIRHFFYPGFATGTGGLLREPDLNARIAAFDAAQWLHSKGVSHTQGEQTISLFCYEPPALVALLTSLATAERPSRLLVTFGRSSTAVGATVNRLNASNPSWNKRSALSISYLPALNQLDFDHLLWASDLNFVRGEDSLVRAIWAGKALVWQIYPQDDAAHHAKLDAFLDMLNADNTLREIHQRWNATTATCADPLIRLDDIASWSRSIAEARHKLLRMDDLTSQLLRFCQEKQ